MTNKIVITTGDVNGIGTEITLKALRTLGCNNVVLVSNRKVLDFYGGADMACELVEIPYDAEISPGKTRAEKHRRTAFRLLPADLRLEYGKEGRVAPIQGHVA